MDYWKYAKYKDRQNGPYTAPVSPDTEEVYIIGSLGDWGYGIWSVHVPIQGQPFTAVLTNGTTTINMTEANLVGDMASLAAEKVFVPYGDMDKLGAWMFDSQYNGWTFKLTSYVAQFSTIGAMLANSMTTKLSDLETRLATIEANGGATTNTAPTFKSGEAPAVKSGSITTSGWTIECDYSDAQGDAITVKAAVSTTNTMPAYGTADWVTVAPTWNATSDKWEIPVTGKNSSTAYYFWVLLEDATHTGSSGTTSSSVPVTTSNAAPSFTVQPSVSNSSATGCDITYTVNDPEGDVLTHKLNLDGQGFVTLVVGSAVSLTTGTATLTSLGSGQYKIAIAGQSWAEASSHNAIVNISDASHASGVDSNTTTWTVPSASNAAPTATNVTLTTDGSPAKGETVTGSYTYSDAEGDLEGTSTYQHYRGTASNGSDKSAISGATALGRPLEEADVGRYSFFGVTPVAQTGTSPGTHVVSTGVLVPVPAPPAILVTAGNAKNTIAWTENANFTTETYNLYWLIDSGTPTADTVKSTGTKITGVTSPYEHLSLTNGSKYNYVLTMVVNGVESAPSAVVSGTPVAWQVTSAGKVADSDFASGTVDGGWAEAYTSGMTVNRNASSVKYNQTANTQHSFIQNSSGLAHASGQRFISIVEYIANPVTSDGVTINRVGQKSTAPVVDTVTNVTALSRIWLDEQAIDTYRLIATYRNTSGSATVKARITNANNGIANGTKLRSYIWSDGTNAYMAVEKVADGTLYSWTEEGTGNNLGGILSIPLSNIGFTTDQWWFQHGDSMNNGGYGSPEFFSASVCKDNRIKVTGLASGQKVKLFASDGTTEIGKDTGTADVNGEAYISCGNSAAKPIEFTGGKQVIIKVYESDGTTLNSTSQTLTVYAGDTVAK